MSITSEALKKQKSQNELSSDNIVFSKPRKKPAVQGIHFIFLGILSISLLFLFLIIKNKAYHHLHSNKTLAFLNKTSNKKIKAKKNNNINSYNGNQPTSRDKGLQSVSLSQPQYNKVVNNTGNHHEQMNQHFVKASANFNFDRENQNNTIITTELSNKKINNTSKNQSAANTEKSTPINSKVNLYSNLIEKVRILEKKHKLNEAASLMNSYSINFNNNTNFYGELAKIYLMMKQPRYSKLIYTRLNKLQPGRGAWLLGLGLSEELLHNKFDAIHYYNQALNTNTLSISVNLFIQNKIQLLST